MANIGTQSHESLSISLEILLTWEVFYLKNSAKATSLTIMGLGTLVTLLSRKALRGKLGAGLTGFGLAHIALGLLDMARPTIRERA